MTVEKIDVGNVVKIDGELAFIIGEDDVEPLSGDTLAAVTARAVAALQRAIAETREARDARLMVAAAIWAGGATVVYVARCSCCCASPARGDARACGASPTSRRTR